MGTEVSSVVSNSDMEFGSTFLYGAGRADCLRYGGGCILSDWAPFSGNAPTSGASVTYARVVSYLGVVGFFYPTD
jgi:hypothetical protein